MCVIIVSNKGLALPNRKTLQKCWDANNHGAGLMYSDGRKVRVRKGFMTLDALLCAMHSIRRPKRKCIVIHFRLATSGLCDESMTHPFPLSAEVADLTAPTVDCDVAVAHNGILGRGEGRLSDTAVFVRDVLAPMGKGAVHPDVRALLAVATGGDKLAILAGCGKLQLVGEWENVDDLWYSNTYWQRAADWKNWKRAGAWTTDERWAEVLDAELDAEYEDRVPAWARDDDKDMPRITPDEDGLYYNCPECGSEIILT